jgi:hypothetical protein
MTWSEVYLICFLVGFALSLLSLAGGGTHVHLPHVHIHIHGISHGHGSGAAGSQSSMSWFNFGTIAAFLAWFGGTGYLLEHYYGVWFMTALIISTVSGLGGAAVVFWFLAKVLVAHEENLDPADYEMIGVLGHLSLPIRQGGTGELIFTQEGVRRVSGARSEDSEAIPKGAEVVVTRYEKGIAYVRRWEDLTGTTEDFAANERG